MGNMTPDSERASAAPQYVVIATIAAPIRRCFEAATAEKAMMHWVPGTVKVVYDHSRAANPYDARSERLVTLRGGLSVVERIDVSEPPHLLIYSLPSFGRFGNMLLSDYRGRMRFEDLGGDRTRLVWEGWFHCIRMRGIVEPVARRLMKGLISVFAKRMKEDLERGLQH